VPGSAILGMEITAIAGLLLYLSVAEPAISHIAAFRSWTLYLPGVAADGLTQAVQAGVTLLPPLAGRPGLRRLGRRGSVRWRRGHRAAGHRLRAARPTR
jgi:membrane protein implicated in regulation of membrane protease activity